VLERTFAVARQDRWQRLETLIALCDKKGLAALAPAELEEIAFLYRSVTTDLAAAQTRGYSAELVAYLNRITARAYAVVHVGSARAGWSNVATFFASTLPREVRASWRIIAATTALFLVATVVSYWLVGFDRNYAPEVSSLIITNNIKVAMVAFAGGIATLGIATVWAIFTNGLMLGGTAALFTHKGFGLDFWATIAPHGVIELTSIQIAGAAGLQFAQAILAPGRLRRIDAIRTAGRRAGVLMIGVAGLLVVAGMIEGFVSPQRISIELRLSIGALTAVLLFSYFGLAGREPQSSARALTSK
jgi:uncharacterized membrane protein SpoIIM required for sporulation